MSLRSSPIAYTLAPAIGVGALLYMAAGRYLGSGPEVSAYLAINAVTYPVWAIDKRQAKKGKFRVPEWTLHLLSMLGGGVGAVLAMRTLRHKTRKPIFRFGHPLLAALGVAALGWALARGA